MRYLKKTKRLFDALARLPHAAGLHHVRHRRGACGGHDVHGLCAVHGTSCAVLFALILIRHVWIGAGGTARVPRIAGPPGERRTPLWRAGPTCQQCHEAGRKVTAARCLTCHKPIADRIAGRKGVHRSVTECVSCHVEHAGVDAELRHLDTRDVQPRCRNRIRARRFARQDGGQLRRVPQGRSFLDARTTCSSCHADVHKGGLGADCTRCHSTQVPFKQARRGFDHTKARFQLTGAHREVACEKCHKSAVFREMDVFRDRELGACAACHEDRTDESSVRRARRATPRRPGTRATSTMRKRVFRWPARTSRSPARSATRGRA